MKPKTLLGYAAITFLIFICIKDPHAPDVVAQNVGNFLSSVARGLSDFLDSL